jgi:hypothetical protein
MHTATSKKEWLPSKTCGGNMKLRQFKETRDCKIQDAVFKIRFIPRRIWRDIITGMYEAVGGLQFGSITEEEIVELKKGDVPKSVAKNKMELFRKNVELQKAYYDMVRFGVIDHSGLENEHGKLAFEMTLENLYNFKVVSEELMEIYDLNNLVLPLGTAVLEFNTLTEDDKKN